MIAILQTERLRGGAQVRAKAGGIVFRGAHREEEK